MKQGLYIHPTSPRIVNGRTSVAVEFFFSFIAVIFLWFCSKLSMVITSYVSRLDKLAAKKIIIDSGEKVKSIEKHNKTNIKPSSLNLGIQFKVNSWTLIKHGPLNVTVASISHPNYWELTNVGPIFKGQSLPAR